MRRAGRMDDYTLIPSERDANRAAAEYAQSHYAGDVEVLAWDVRFRHFVETPTPVENLLEETVTMIWEYVDQNELDDQDDKRRPLRPGPLICVSNDALRTERVCRHR